MALVISDRVKETSLTTGTGTITLNGTYGGFQSFSSGIGDGNTTYYAIENDAAWEVGIGTYTQSSNTLSRDTILKSSNSNNAISLNGVSRVFCTYPSDKAVYLDANNDITFAGTAGFDDITAHNITVSGLADLGNVNTSGSVVVSGDLLFYPTNQNDTFTMQRNAAGNFFHGYIDTTYDRTLALHTDGGMSPTWKLGLKTSPNSATEAPDHAYIYGIDSDMGLIANSNNSVTISNAAGFNVKHKNSTIITAHTTTGIHIDSVATAYPALTVNGGVSLAANIQEWSNSAGTVLSAVDKDGNFAVGKNSADYEVDVDGSGKFGQIYLTTGIIFADGTTQTTASVGGGGGTDYSAAILNNTSSGVAISGWAAQTIINSGVAVSGWADATFLKAEVDTLQTVTDRGATTTNTITAPSAVLDVLDMNLLANGDQPTHSEGIVFYDSENHTLSLYNDEADVTLQLGQEEFLRVRNNTGAPILNGSGVKITGAHGNAAPTVAYAQANTEANSQIVGLATHDIEDASFGYVTTNGIVRDVNTSTFTAGDELFLSASNEGALVNTSPVIPNYKVSVGHVINSHAANGSVLVQIGHPKLGGGDLKSEAELNESGIPFVTSISNTTAGGSQTDPLFIYDSGNRQLQLGSGVQLLDGVPSNTSNVLYNNGGTLSWAGSGSFEGLIVDKAIKTEINTEADGATITFDMNESNTHMVTLGGTRTLAVSNVASGQKFMIRLKQDTGGNRTVNWFSTIYWAEGGTAPTLTTTANKADLFGFLCTSGTEAPGGPYLDGFVIGQNI